MAGFVPEEDFIGLRAVDVVRDVGLITCERVVYRHEAILLVVRRGSG